MARIGMTIDGSKSASRKKNRGQRRGRRGPGQLKMPPPASCSHLPAGQAWNGGRPASGPCPRMGERCDWDRSHIAPAAAAAAAAAAARPLHRRQCIRMVRQHTFPRSAEEFKTDLAAEPPTSGTSVCIKHPCRAWGIPPPPLPARCKYRGGNQYHSLVQYSSPPYGLLPSAYSLASPVPRRPSGGCKPMPLSVGPEWLRLGRLGLSDEVQDPRAKTRSNLVRVSCAGRPSKAGMAGRVDVRCIAFGCRQHTVVVVTSWTSLDALRDRRHG